jgi:membrane-associated protease RseP (regulator of RpoE activity)
VALGVVGVPGGSVTGPPGNPTEWEIISVSDGSAASRAGLESGDKITAIDGRPAHDFDAFTDAIGSHDVGDAVTFEVERDGDARTVDSELGARPANEPGGRAGSAFLGVGTAAVYPDEPIGLGTALVRAPGEMVGFMGDSVGALAGFFSPDGLTDYADNVSRARDEPATDSGGSSSGSQSDGSENRMLSIFGAVRLAGQMSEVGGLAFLLLFFFQINIFIGIFNMVPLPPLDGGHAAVAIYERIRSRGGSRYHADVTKLLPLTYAVLMGLVLLGVTSLYLDIVNPIDI